MAWRLSATCRTVCLLYMWLSLEVFTLRNDQIGEAGARGRMENATKQHAEYAAGPEASAEERSRLFDDAQASLVELGMGGVAQTVALGGDATEKDDQGNESKAAKKGVAGDAEIQSGKAVEALKAEEAANTEATDEAAKIEEETIKDVCEGFIHDGIGAADLYNLCVPFWPELWGCTKCQTKSWTCNMFAEFGFHCGDEEVCGDNVLCGKCNECRKDAITTVQSKVRGIKGRRQAAKKKRDKAREQYCKVEKNKLGYSRGIPKTELPQLCIDNWATIGSCPTCKNMMANGWWETWTSGGDDVCEVVCRPKNNCLVAWSYCSHCDECKVKKNEWTKAQRKKNTKRKVAAKFRQAVGNLGKQKKALQDIEATNLKEKKKNVSALWKKAVGTVEANNKMEKDNNATALLYKFDVLKSMKDATKALQDADWNFDKACAEVDAIQKLVDMGFEYTRVRNKLVEKDWDADLALEALLD